MTNKLGWALVGILAMAGCNHSNRITTHAPDDTLIAVQSEATGVIAQLYPLGAQVHKGDVLAEIESTDTDLRIQRARAELDRVRTSGDDALVTSAQRQYDRATHDLAHLVVRAPVDGTSYSSTVFVGQRILAGRTVITLMTPHRTISQ